MWKLLYAIGVLFGAVLIMVMWHSWGMSWKQIGVYMLLSLVSRVFFDASRDLRREEKTQRNNASGEAKQTT